MGFSAAIDAPNQSLAEPWCTRLPSSSTIPSTGQASRPRQRRRLVPFSHGQLLARVPVCDVTVHTDGFPFYLKD